MEATNTARSMSIAPDDVRWIGTIEGIDTDGSPLWALADEVRQSRGGSR